MEPFINKVAACKTHVHEFCEMFRTAILCEQFHLAKLKTSCGFIYSAVNNRLRA